MKIIKLPVTEAVPNGTVIRKRQAAPDEITANFSRRSHFDWVDFTKIRVDSLYQRNLRAQKSTLMAHRWNPDKLGTLVVSHRDDGFYYLIDGQHRYAAMNLIKNHPPKVYCEVFEGLTVEEEASLFNGLDSDRDNLTRGASFKALVAAKDSTALEIVAAAADAGMTVDYDKGPVVGNVRAHKTLLDIHRRNGPAMITRILRVCNVAWPTSNHAAPEPVMRAMEIIYSKHDNVSDKRLVSVLSKYSPDQIIIMGRQINSGLSSSSIAPAIAVVIRNLYNKQLKPDNKLNQDKSLGV